MFDKKHMSGTKKNRCLAAADDVKPYRTPPSSNIQSSATHKCCGMELMIYLVNKFFLNIKILSLKKF